MGLAINTFYFVLAVSILITVHEWGHFLVARWNGVKVLRFSIGFGKPLIKYQGKKGTEYILAAIPLGGYVKMLDEEEEHVPDEDKPYAFNRQSVWARLAIVIAGPLFNFLFAIVAIWLMFVIGINTLAPIIQQVKMPSVAEKAGFKSMDEVMAVAGRPVQNWRDFQLEMVTHLGQKKPITIEITNHGSKQTNRLLMPMDNWQLDHKKPDVLDSIGITPFVPSIKPIVGKVVHKSAAQLAGLKPGDKILSVNGKPIRDWIQLVHMVRKNPGEMLLLSVKRNHQTLPIKLIPRRKEENGKTIGFVGLTPKSVDWPAGWLRMQHYGLWESVPRAFTETWNLTTLSFKMLAKFVSGDVSLRNIGGPIGIAQGAGQSARVGIEYYLSFLALVSISLGILNILPIPMLDGGHVLFYLIELVRRRPLDEKTKQKALMFGLVLLLAVTTLAIFNDVVRLMY